MSQLRKVTLDRHIVLSSDSQPARTFAGGREHITDPETARELVAKGARYVDDDDYNSTIKATPKADPKAGPKPSV